MLRVMRLKSSDQAAQWHEAANGLSAFINSLGLPSEAKSLIADREVDGEYLNFYSPSEGSLEQVPMMDGQALFSQQRLQAQTHFNERRELILQRIQPVLDAEAQAYKDSHNGQAATTLPPSPALMLKVLLTNPQHLIILNESVPVIIPFFDDNHLNDALARNGALLSPAAAAASASTASASRLGIIAALILLLLLALGLLWYFLKLWPWPFVDEAQQQREQQLAALEESLVKDQALLKDINDLIDKTDLRLELANELNKNEELDKLIDTLRKDQQNLDEINKLIALTEQDEEAAAKAAADAAKAAAEKAAAEAATKKATTANATKLPKCELIKKQGKMPHLVIATDGSGSMLNLMDDRTFRIDAAMKAAMSLVDNVDKNVPIRLFGIQGCPLARDYGVYSGAQRAALKNSIRRTDPRRVVGVLPIQVTTPLVSALRGMASSVPANVDSVGILISDGVDTCEGTEHLNLCDVARQIHQQRPKLKINVVLIGEDADSAKCIASITGGKLYKPSDSITLTNDLKNAGSTLVKVCQ